MTRRGEAALEFTETLEGSLGRSAAVSGTFWCRLLLRVLHPLALREAQSAAAAVTGGELKWSYLGGNATITGGFVNLFHQPRDPGEPTAISYHFTFTAGGAQYTFHGEKKLSGGSGFDALNDLGEVQVVVDGPGGFHIAGALSCRVDELLRGYEGAVVRGEPPGGDPASALDHFHAFLNRQLHTVFSHVPALLAADQRMTDGLRRTLGALAEAFLPKPLPPNGPAISDVVARIVEFLQNASGAEIQRVRTLLQIIGIFVPILELEPEGIRKEIRRALSTEKDSLIREALVGAHQIVVFAYYADTRADRLLHYARPTHRPKRHTHLPVSASVPKRVFDVVIAGTGPAGALLADRLSRRGKSVLLLEAGRYIPEDSITTDELDSIARLYKGSGLQAAVKPSSITVLQGACVGGGGVINNGIFFPLSGATLQNWRNAGFPISTDTLWQAYRVVASDLNIGDVADKALSLNPASVVLEAKFGRARAAPIDGPVPPGFYRMAVNLETRIGDGEKIGCLSTGLCNLGCGSERKVNSFQHYLGKALNDSARDVVLVPNALAIKAVMENGTPARRVAAIQARMADGSTVLARGREFVLACGAVGSSAVLLRSIELLEAAAPRLPVGKRFCGNVASPVFALASGNVNTGTFVQMTHVYVPDGADDGFLIESWFSPPGGLALAMPGFLEDHAQRMSQYSRLVCVSPVVGTQPGGSVVLKGEETVIDLPLAPVDLDRFRRGLLAVVAALQTGGANPVIVRLGNGRVIATPDDLAGLDKEMRALSQQDLFKLPMSTAHPQGGNAMSDTPELGVVGADFRLRGIENLRVCDGSVFPAVAGVNPQWTIFALAHICAASMAN